MNLGGKKKVEVVLTMSSFIIFGSLIYLVYHLIQKRKHRERILPKKIFYPTLIGGLLLFSIASSLTDTSVQDALDKAREENTTLATEIKEFKLTNKTLEKANSKLTEENEKAIGEIKTATEEIEELTLKLADFENFEQELTDEKQAHKENSEALQNEITELKETNTSLASEVESLKGQVASASANTASNVSSSNSGSRSSSDTSSAPSPPPVETPTPEANANVYYKNCTAARNAGAAPVRRGDPGYASHLDRDGDGIGCE